MSSQTRYTILLDAPTVSTLNDLQRKFGLTTRAAVFDLALVVLNWVAKQEEDGYEVGRAKGDNFQPLLLPRMQRSVPPAPAPATSAADEAPRIRVNPQPHGA
ncbi:hypothetical protein [Azohydromonas caseinilytica]|uniref:Uncharacterized protein n=1 Tax=Azohydromonas caseinilytica TaxID=2728836 RepID=A0A848FJ53_9BURK|nr:hypothetical protein [Azohydromonas caseinilytica]NML19166.1 hypothetical protein [Azohydromonas caseinilytica]